MGKRRRKEKVDGEKRKRKEEENGQETAPLTTNAEFILALTLAEIPMLKSLGRPPLIP